MHGNLRVSFRFAAVFVANSFELTSTPLSALICEFMDMIRFTRSRASTRSKCIDRSFQWFLFAKLF